MDGTEVEQGWSNAPTRKLWRLLARRHPGPHVPLRSPQGLASITFDDIPECAARLGAPVLERAGARGTFYVAAALSGCQDRHWRLADASQIRALADAGHEIGCHTARHVNVQSLGPAALTAECDRNRELLGAICGLAPRNFCYPFGDVGWRQRRLLASRFTTCRTIYERPNAGRVDPAMLGAFGLFDATYDRGRLRARVQEAKASGGWLVLYTHDVQGEPTPIGCTPRVLAEALALLADHGLPVVTMEAGAARNGLPPRG